MRVVIALLDGVGVGALPDAHRYKDMGAHTLLHTARAVGGLRLPCLEKMGLGCIDSFPGIHPSQQPIAFHGKMQERSAGKDTTTGHWEIAGLILDQPFPLYPQGFPEPIVREIERVFGKRILGNVPASGTEIINQLGKEHLRTGFPIVYTSADSVFQVACHEDIIPPGELYDLCRRARAILQGEHGVARVIARPFSGKPGNFVRTPRRKDFSLPPPAPTILDAVVKRGKTTVGVGKINDIFAQTGVSKSYPVSGNKEIFSLLIDIQKEKEGDLVWANFNDFDTLYGHRNDPKGFAASLEEWDRQCMDFLPLLGPEDLFFVTSDHGCDPTYPGTDHTREYAMLLSYFSGTRVTPSSLGIRKSFADLGASAASFLGVPWKGAGRSFAG